MADILKLYKVATKAAYDSIKVKSTNNLYFVEKYDNGPALFKGEKRYTVSKEELDNILKGYSKTGHTHNPADINVNSSNRFVTDTEKSKWNAASTNATNTKKIVENIKMSGSTTSLLNNGEIIIPTIAGPKGEKGVKGDTGPQGVKGATGAKGAKGDTGAAGKDGFNPYWKTTGSTILVANNGERDLKGAKGDKGNTGPKGATGLKGDTGPAGPKGEKGDRGDMIVNDTRNTDELPSFYFKSGRGGNWEFKFKSTIKVNTTGLLGTGGTYCTLQTIIPWGDKSGGYPIQIAYDNQSNLFCKRVGTSDTTWSAWELMKGSKGDRGDTGPMGPAGPKGNTGAVGTPGAKGEKGDTGPRGANGTNGAKGADGFNPHWKTTGSTILVASNGERDLKGAKGDTGAKGPQGLKGEKGDTGAKGPQGLKGEKGDTGSDANVTKDNVEIALGYTPLPQSGGLLNDYVEKLVIIGEINSINLDEGNTFLKTISADTTFSIDNTKAGAHSFTLIIEMDTLSALTFPTEVKWQDGEAPDMSEVNKTYILTFLTIDNGLTWFGMKGGAF